jgi:hypothetical protein
VSRFVAQAIFTALTPPVAQKYTDLYTIYLV